MTTIWNSGVSIDAYKNRFQETINKKEIKEDKREIELYDYLVSQKNDIDSNNDGRITYSEFVKSRLNITAYVEQADKELLANAKDGIDIKQALAKGADVNAKNEWGTALILAVSKNVLTILLNNGWSAKKEAVKALIEAGADLNAQNKEGNTALMIAIRNGKTEILNLLTDAGADVNVPNNKGETALMLAASKDAKLLIEAGADLNAISKGGYTALMYAAYSGKTEVVKLLIGAGADLNKKNKRGTALIIAAERGHSGIVKLLIAAGADLNAKNEAGDTALMYVTRRGHAEIEGMLRKAMENLK
ncbi:ankyrin repeat domain-containing protein [Candidatus Margulisiibacteriota bacterium]